MGKIFILVNDYDSEATWMPIDEDKLDLSEHDAEIWNKFIDEMVDIFNSTPRSSVEQITHYLEQMKGAEE